jgi:hypothetical protein
MGITLFGVLFILVVAGALLLSLFLSRSSDAVVLPEIPTASESIGLIEPDALNRVEVTRETIQAVVSSLSRPAIYSRDMVIESFWEGGQAQYNVSVSVMNGLTSLKTLPPIGVEKRIIVTPNTLYIWYKDDLAPYKGGLGSFGDDYRTADEWQMLVTYEDVLELDKDGIIDAGYVEYAGEDCLFAKYLSPLLKYTRTFYISRELGLIIRAEESDESGNLIYAMTAGDCSVNEIDPTAFILPDGTDLGH